VKINVSYAALLPLTSKFQPKIKPAKLHQNLAGVNLPTSKFKKFKITHKFINSSFQPFLQISSPSSLIYSLGTL
jgi:hypothetical protein